MPDVGYSDKAIRALGDPQPPERKIVYKVQTVPGLWIAVHAGGARSWFLRYSIGGDRRKMVLGRYPEMTLRKAKAAAEAKLYGIIHDKVDPQDTRADRVEGTFQDLVSLYMRENAKGKLALAPSTLADRRRQMDRPEIDRIRKKRPSEITEEDIARVLAPFKTRDALVMANRTQESIAAILQFARHERLFAVTDNPARTLPQRLKHEHIRDRVLTDDEIRLVWHDLEQRTPLIRAILRVVLLTGQRPGEIRRARWDYIEGATLRMPKGYRKKTKADRGAPPPAHDVPLSPRALRELEAVRVYERGGFIFPAKGVEPFRPMAHQTVARAVARIREKHGMERWTPKDVQRTARTRWSEDLRADFVVAEKTQGHVLPPVQRAYDRSVRWDERVELLDRWAERLVGIVGGPE